MLSYNGAGKIRAPATNLTRPSEESVPNPLVVVRVQPEHVTEMVDRAVDIARTPTTRNRFIVSALQCDPGSGAIDHKRLLFCDCTTGRITEAPDLEVPDLRGLLIRMGVDG